jgi:hypothetical protein
MPNSQGDSVNAQVARDNIRRAASNPNGENAHRREVVANATAKRK